MIKTLNKLGQKGDPFFFLISFDKKEFYASTLEELDSDILYEFDSFSSSEKVKLKKDPIDFKKYEKKILDLKQEIRAGNTYLGNFCCKTPIEIEDSLKDIYYKSNGKYKLYFKDKFVCFSPECFIKIDNNKIFTFPMKGTINSTIPKAKEKILEDKKELAEHIMAVDLLRNDLSIVSKKVRVEDFRYIERVGELLQVSSKIVGDLDENWRNNIGEIFDKLLPAGSISGTPKKNTVKILKKLEDFERGFFTGVFGVYENNTLNSGVIIRYIEKDNGKFYFKSGGGITESSKPLDEYSEMKSKIYVP